MTDPLVQLEHKKREHCWSAKERWRVLQETIAWVDSQQPIPRNSREGCLQHQAALLAMFDKLSQINRHS